MPRYFLSLAYLGTHYNGWQRQPNAPSVQAVLEQALSTVLRQQVEVTGCGRTDAGVHARYFVAHFDAVVTEPSLLPTAEQPADRLLFSLNGLLPPDISIFGCAPVSDGAHARFDATARIYEFVLSKRKNPFLTFTAWHYPQAQRLNIAAMQDVAALLPQYEAFYPFCKTHSGVDHYRCAIQHAYWEDRPEEQLLVFHIGANRFLRGMVRLIVGACVQVGAGQISLAAVQEALDKQQSLRTALSVPPQGLSLTGVEYPFRF
jgi:tRNA pseudouridine38-40 synthase